MKAQKILITGATGMLGSKIWDELQQEGQANLFAVGRSASHHNSNFIACNLADPVAFRQILDELKPDVVIHSAANVNLNDCEKEKAYTYQLHVLASRVIASCKYIKKSIYISTDSVFDGITGNYREDDYVAPLNYYALTKALGEEAFANASHPSIVLRTNIFGFSKPLRSSLFEWAWANLNDNQVIAGYSNVFFNPLYVGSLAKIVNQLLHQEEATGILHVGTRHGLSKYEFISKVADIFNFSPSLIRSGLADNNGAIKRPMNTILNTDKVETEYKIAMPEIEQELLNLFQDFKRN